MRLRLGIGLLAAVLVVTPTDARAQDPLLEGRLLRSAASMESRGDLEGAEGVLRDLMSQRPTSTGGLFALERVLRAQGRLSDVLPAADAFLEVDPRAAAPNILKMRVLALEGDRDGLVAAAEHWKDADPGSPDVYREVSRAFSGEFGAERGVSVLLEGREAVGDATAFSMELGDFYRDMGRPEEAVREWSRAVGDDGGQVAAVIRRLEQLEGDRATLAKPLIDQLADPAGSVARRRAGARIALDLGLVDEALEIARGVVPELRGQTRRGFLADLARRAEEADEPAIALWSYQALRDNAAAGSEARSLDQRIAESALAVGDTTRALEARERVVASLDRGSTERRRAVAEVTRLVIALDPQEGRARLETLRAEFPDAPEIDPLAVTLAGRFQSIGDHERAESILAGISGPRSSLERGYLQFGQGQIEEGLASLNEALEGLPASDATEVITLLELMDRLEGDPKVEVARAASLVRQGRGMEAVRVLRTGVSEGWAESPSLLAFAARIADAEEADEQAAEIRSQLIEAHPQATEIPEAVLALARYLGRTPEGVAQAVTLLEDLILARPGNPLVPAARREMDRLRRTAGGAGEIR